MTDALEGFVCQRCGACCRIADGIVRVGDYDICACIGAHVHNTAEIGIFKLVSHDFTPKTDCSGILRIRFRVS